MDYCNFSLDQLMKYNVYKEMCEKFFLLAYNDDIKSKLEVILYQGGYGELAFSSKIVNRDNPYIEIKRRISMAYLLLLNPEAFDILVDCRVNLFHGTNSNALSSILSYGLNSLAESEKLGIYVSTGEKWSRTDKLRNFVSFTDIFDVALNYSMLKPEDNNLSFGVIIGTSVSDVQCCKTCNVISNISEVGVVGKLPIEKIRVVCVPSDKVNFVKKMVSDKNIMVLGLDGMDTKFYLDDDFSRLSFSEQKFNILKDYLYKRRKRLFDFNDIRDLTLNVLISDMINGLVKIRKIMSGDEKNDRRSNKL